MRKENNLMQYTQHM